MRIKSGEGEGGGREIKEYKNKKGLREKDV